MKIVILLFLVSFVSAYQDDPPCGGANVWKCNPNCAAGCDPNTCLCIGGCGPGMCGPYCSQWCNSPSCGYLQPCNQTTCKCSFHKDAPSSPKFQHEPSNFTTPILMVPECNCSSNPFCNCPDGFVCCPNDHHRCCRGDACNTC